MLAPKPNPLMFSSPLAATTAATPYTTDAMEPALRAWLAAITVIVLLGALFVFLRYWRQAYKTRIVWTISIAITALLALGVVAIWIVVAAMPVALNVGHPLLSQNNVGRHYERFRRIRRLAWISLRPSSCRQASTSAPSSSPPATI